MGIDEEKKKQRDNAWQRKNYKRLGVKLYKEDAEAFEKYCKENGTSVNAVLRKCVAECIGRPLTIRSESKEDGKEADDEKS